MYRSVSDTTTEFFWVAKKYRSRFRHKNRKTERRNKIGLKSFFSPSVAKQTFWKKKNKKCQFLEVENSLGNIFCISSCIRPWWSEIFLHEWEVTGSAPAGFKLFSREPAALKLVRCQHTKKHSGGFKRILSLLRCFYSLDKQSLKYKISYFIRLWWSESELLLHFFAFQRAPTPNNFGTAGSRKKLFLLLVQFFQLPDLNPVQPGAKQECYHCAMSSPSYCYMNQRLSWLIFLYL